MTTPAATISCRSSWAPPATQQQCPHHRQQRHWQAEGWRLKSGRPILTACRAESRVRLYDAYNQQIPYEQAWRFQKQLVEEVAAATAAASSSGAGSSHSGGGGDEEWVGSLLLLQHPPVYTLGTGSTEGHLKFDADASPLPLYRTERGGEVTYHGPGQLVMYPVLNLRHPRFQPDLHWYLRSLEEVVIRALDAVSGLQGERIDGLTGVWVGGQKVAAIGVRASRWVTYHGLALNVANDLSPFRQIVPCGISDRPVGSVQGLLQAAAEAQAPPLEAWEDPLAASFQPAAAVAAAAAAGDLGGGDPRVVEALAATLRQQLQQPPPPPPAWEPDREQLLLLEEYRHGLLDAFQEVFGVQLAAAGPADLQMSAPAVAVADSAAAAVGGQPLAVGQ